jgi:hypothetical protein
VTSGGKHDVLDARPKGITLVRSVIPERLEMIVNDAADTSKKPPPFLGCSYDPENQM